MQPEVTEARIFDMDKSALDAYPDGVITLQRDGTIVNYNRAEAELSRRDATTTIGLNFFTDVAPCTAVQDFKGRFDAFAAQSGAGVERFEFVFKFAWGRQDVSITMVRKADVPHVNLLVSRRNTAG